MMRILRKATSSKGKSGGSSTAEQYAAAVDVDLSTWELVNASQSDDEDSYSYDGDDVRSGGGGAAGDEPEPDPEQGDEDARGPRGMGPPGEIISLQSLSVSPPMTLPVEMTRNHVYDGDGDGDVYGDDDDDDDQDYGHADDVDDELVPWELKHKFGKQRIKKMGKRSGPNFKKSKRLPYYYKAKC